MTFSLSFVGQNSFSTLCKATGILGVLAGCPLIPWHLEVKETPRTVTYNFAVAEGMIQGRFLSGKLTRQENLHLRQAQAQALVAVTNLPRDEEDDDSDQTREAGQKVAELLWQIEHD